MRLEMEEAAAVVPGSPIRGRARANATDTSPFLQGLDSELNLFMDQHGIPRSSPPLWSDSWCGRVLEAVRVSSCYGGGNLIKGLIEALIVSLS